MISAKTKASQKSLRVTISSTIRDRHPRQFGTRIGRMSQPGPTGWILPLVPFHFTLVQNIKRDPFEQAVGIDQKSAMSVGGALGAPATAFQYEWNMLRIGQQLWLQHGIIPRRYRPFGSYFPLSRLRFIRWRYSDEFRGGKNAGRSTITSRRFNAACVLRTE